jgi:hypothetical protein
MSGRHIESLTKRQRDVLLDRVINTTMTDSEIAARHGYSRGRVNTIVRSELGRAYCRELEERLITESIKACAFVPAIYMFRDALSIPGGRKRRK